MPDAAHDPGFLIVHVRQVGGDEPGQVTVQVEPRRNAGGGQDRLEPLGQVVEQVV